MDKTIPYHVYTVVDSERTAVLMNAPVAIVACMTKRDAERVFSLEEKRGSTCWIEEKRPNGSLITKWHLKKA